MPAAGSPPPAVQRRDAFGRVQTREQRVHCDAVGRDLAASVLRKPVTPARAVFERMRFGIGWRTAIDVIATTRPQLLRAHRGHRLVTHRDRGAAVELERFEVLVDGRRSRSCRRRTTGVGDENVDPAQRGARVAHESGRPGRRRKVGDDRDRAVTELAPPRPRSCRRGGRRSRPAHPSPANAAATREAESLRRGGHRGAPAARCRDPSLPSGRAPKARVTQWIGPDSVAQRSRPAGRCGSRSPRRRSRSRSPPACGRRCRARSVTSRRAMSASVMPASRSRTTRPSLVRREPIAPM